MVNNKTGDIAGASPSAGLQAASIAVRCYVGLTAATVAALIVMSAVAPQLATSDAWGHAVIVVIFAFMLPLRLRSARKGSTRAVRASIVIAAVLLLVNVVEAALPTFPGWMRAEMALIALLMLLVVGLLTGRVRSPGTGTRGRAARVP